MWTPPPHGTPITQEWRSAPADYEPNEADDRRRAEIAQNHWKALEAQKDTYDAIKNMAEQQQQQQACSQQARAASQPPLSDEPGGGSRAADAPGSSAAGSSSDWAQPRSSQRGRSAPPGPGAGGGSRAAAPDPSTLGPVGPHAWAPQHAPSDPAYEGGRPLSPERWLSPQELDEEARAGIAPYRQDQTGFGPQLAGRYQYAGDDDEPSMALAALTTAGNLQMRKKGFMDRAAATGTTMLSEPAQVLPTMQGFKLLRKTLEKSGHDDTDIVALVQSRPPVVARAEAWTKRAMNQAQEIYQRTTQVADRPRSYVATGSSDTSLADYAVAFLRAEHQAPGGSRAADPRWGEANDIYQDDDTDDSEHYAPGVGQLMDEAGGAARTPVHTPHVLRPEPAEASAP